MQQVAEQSANQKNPADFLPLNGTDFVEFYVGNARQSARIPFVEKFNAATEPFEDRKYYGDDADHKKRRVTGSPAKLQQDEAGLFAGK